MTEYKDGPVSHLFSPLPLHSGIEMEKLKESGLSPLMLNALDYAPSGSCISWGIPFEITAPVLIKDQPVSLDLPPAVYPWLVMMHTTDISRLVPNSSGFFSPMRGLGHLGQIVCDYIFMYSDGTEERSTIKKRHQIGVYFPRSPEICFEAVRHVKPRQLPGDVREAVTNGLWGFYQGRSSVTNPDLPWVNWIWAWKNPFPEKEISGIRIEPAGPIALLFALTAGDVTSNPIRWQTRQKAVLTLPEGENFDPILDDLRNLSQVKLDMGQVISAQIRPKYPNDTWDSTYNNKLPDFIKNEILVEYTAHPEAVFHLSTGRTVPLSDLKKESGPIAVIKPSEKKVTLKTVKKEGKDPLSVKLHVHGESDEYLTPMDRQRFVNASWFQDWALDFSHRQTIGMVNMLANTSTDVHHCTYIPGKTTIKLPLGQVFIEVSKGFEFTPIRKVVEVGPATEEIEIELEKSLSWREKGWVTADTHVHFLSPTSALLEGAAEGVNVVNLLATQWGEMMTNVGDFDGETVHTYREAGKDGEYLVRVGSENRQQVLGHISLLGYQGDIITPLSSGGPDESALGDPLEVLLTEWAAQCRRQGGIVVMPHFPFPRCESAATIITGNVDGIEMTAWGDLYSGISPLSLSDWYRYLNCGYMTAAVGGTDKMNSDTAVGTVRTYARIKDGEEFTYENWMKAVRRADTFVTYGPLIEFAVEGRPPGSRFNMTDNGGTVDVTWKAASVSIPMSKAELVVNGEIIESNTISPDEDEGSWSVKLDKSSWLALLIRGHYSDKPEVIAAHSSPVMVELDGSEFMAAADALTILEQIEGALAFVDTIGTRAEAETYKRMRMVLTSAHRELHNRMHRNGLFHEHAQADKQGGGV